MFECFAACIFFGTPFKGAHMAAVASMYASLANAFGQEWYTSLLQFMTTTSQALHDLRSNFRAMETLLSPKINLYCVYEMEKTDFGKLAKEPWRSFIVNQVAKIAISTARAIILRLLGHADRY